MSLFEQQPISKSKIVNVASVRQLSPFRYPGGKTWLVPIVREWLQQRDKKPAELVEVFAGGGIIGLTAAQERLADHVTMIELDPDVASVWLTILSGDAEWLAEKILGFELTVLNAHEAIEKPFSDTKERAFQTILRNRICHGGILAHGSGFLKHGENGKGIASRWYPETLAKRIRYIMTFRDRITFIEGDGLCHLRNVAKIPDVAFFIDPPYTAPGKRAGKRLYNFFEINHEELFDIVSTLNGDFMMTYDDAGSVREMAEARGFFVSHVLMKGTHHNKMFELLVTPCEHIL
ncbi:MAG: DNA adenine methylase [Nitrospirae bacterium]|nr:DNA adenine methylase [Nitrospirota bacterium]